MWSLDDYPDRQCPAKNINRSLLRKKSTKLSQFQTSRQGIMALIKNPVEIAFPSN